MGHPQSVGHVLRRAFGLLVALIVVSGLAGVAVSLVQRQAVRELTEEVYPAEVANLHLRVVLLDAARARRGYLISGDPSQQVQFDADRASYGPAERQLRQVARRQEQPLIEEQSQLANQWWAYADSTRDLQPGSPGIRTRLPAAQAMLNEALAANDELDARLTDRAQRLGQRSARLNTALLAMLIGVVLLAVLLAWVTARRTTRRIVRPLEELTTVLTKVGQGDLDARVHTRTDLVEIGAVATATNAMAAEVAQARGRQDRLLGQEHRLVAELRQLENAKNEFMTTVSHELRTPLTSIAGYLETLRDGDAGPLTARQDTTIGVLERNATRLTSLVEDLLVLSQVEAGTLSANRVPVDIVALVRAAADDARPAAEALGVTLRVEAEGEVVAAVDAALLRRAVGHLLGNAVKFTASGGSAAVRVTGSGDQTIIQVTDTGIGIPYEEQPRLFTAFFRASNVADQAIPGSGLGLVVVRTIVGRHGGGVDVKSDPGRGTSVVITLPVRTE